MKRLSFISILVLFLLMSVGCVYNDASLWKEIEDIKNRLDQLEKSVKNSNADIQNLQQIINALNKNLYVTDVETTENGYIIHFSDGSSATISNGKDGQNGKDGVNAPVISIAKDEDGHFWWTIDGEWLLIDGQRVPASSIAPLVRINNDTKEWEISIDGGLTWNGTGVIAEGKDGQNGENGKDGKDGIEIDNTNPDYLIIKLPDGTEIKIPRYKEEEEEEQGGYTLKVLTFEDTDVAFSSYTLDYASKTVTCWSDLIDNPQYGGPLLYADYSSAEYTWYDENNTYLQHSFPYNYGAYCYWGGGHAISNYTSEDIEATGSFESQLTVFGKEGKGGHNGSANFAVHFGYMDGSQFNMTEFLPSLVFGDGTPRVIDHMYVMNINYALNCYLNGNSLTANIGPDDWVKLIATGFDADGKETGSVEIFMCNGPDNIIREWTKWDLSPLGEVLQVEFNVTGSSDNGYGFSQPAYFAYDDVTVRF